jgi:geranylgeranyl diphosphate synthase, type I
MTDIMDFLESKRKEINGSIERVAPRKISSDYAERAFGKPRFGYDLDSLNKSLSDPVWDLLDRGGKRWRPALFLLITEMLGKDPESVMDFAAIPEMVHNGTLMVDDCQDLGELRRGKPCTHKLYGQDVAINTGNYMYFIPMLTVMESKDLDDTTKSRLYESFFQEMINVSVGQALDIWWHKGKKPDITEDQYLQMCAYKTGTLARLAARMAAILAGTDSDTEVLLGRLAESLGVGFQIQDDVLSASEGEFNKRKGVGDDITEGKRTLIVIHCLKHAPEAERKELVGILDKHTRDPKLISRALRIMRKSGSVDYAKGFASRLVQDAWKEAEPVLPDNDAKKILESLMDFAITRKI